MKKFGEGVNFCYFSKKKKKDKQIEWAKLLPFTPLAVTATGDSQNEKLFHFIHILFKKLCYAIVIAMIQYSKNSKQFKE